METDDSLRVIPVTGVGSGVSGVLDSQEPSTNIPNVAKTSKFLIRVLLKSDSLFVN